VHAVIEGVICNKMSKWMIQKSFDGKTKFRTPILVEGLPGIGNVGKIAVDFLIDSLKPDLLYKIHSHSFPHSVFLNENNRVELPSVNILNYRAPARDIMFLAGDVQPISERASYEFCEKMLDFMQELGCNDIITLGGIGLPSEVKSPAIFGAVTDDETLKKYKKYKGIAFSTNQRVDAIVGASGLLLGLARLRGMRGVSLLTETYANQFHFGFLEAKTVLFELKKILELKNLDLAPLEREIETANRQRLKLERNQQEPRQLKRFRAIPEAKPDTGYIG